MEIFTVEDADFPSIQEALRRSLVVGEYCKGETTRRISLARHLLLVSIPEDPHRIGVSYARTDAEAEIMASRLLAKAVRRGHTVQVEPGYESLVGKLSLQSDAA